MKDIKLTPEITAVLEAYTKLQQEERDLKERKKTLQEKLKAHLRGDAKQVWYPEVDDLRLKISYRSVPQVEYDEKILRNRLGERYRSILAPDLRRLKVELPNMESELEPLLNRIGSPSQEKVKAAIETGLATSEEFKGAFTKTVKEYITVATLTKMKEISD